MIYFTNVLSSSKIHPGLQRDNTCSAYVNLTFLLFCLKFIVLKRIVCFFFHLHATTFKFVNLLEQYEIQKAQDLVSLSCVIAQAFFIVPFSLISFFLLLLKDFLVSAVMTKITSRNTDNYS